MARLQGFKHYNPSWKKWLCTFFHPIKVPSQNTSTYQSAGTVTVLFSLTPSSNLAGLLCALPARWCAFCLYEKEFTVVTFITACHREARGAFLVSSLGSVGLISKLPRVSGDLQHQTSVTQTSLWFLYMYFMFFSNLFSWKNASQISSMHGHTLYDTQSPHLMAPWCFHFRGTSDLMPVSLRDLVTVDAFNWQHITLFTTSSGSKVNTEVKQRAHCSFQSCAIQLDRERFSQTASACHEITASPNLRGDYHLTISLLSLIPLLGVNCLTYDGGEDSAVSDGMGWIRGNDRGMGGGDQRNERVVGDGFRVWFRNLYSSFQVKMCI